MGRIYYNSNGVILENSKILFDGELPIYWGTYIGRTVDEQYILNNFQSETITLDDGLEFFHNIRNIFFDFRIFFLGRIFLFRENIF